MGLDSTDLKGKEKKRTDLGSEKKRNYQQGQMPYSIQYFTEGSGGFTFPFPPALFSLLVAATITAAAAVLRTLGI